MDPNTGNIYQLDDVEAKKRKLIEVLRPLTEREVRTQKIGFNSPCGCGSGIKFKRCCYGKRL